METALSYFFMVLSQFFTNFNFNFATEWHGFSAFIYSAQTPCWDSQLRGICQVQCNIMIIWSGPHFLYVFSRLDESTDEWTRVTKKRQWKENQKLFPFYYIPCGSLEYIRSNFEQESPAQKKVG